MQKQQKIFEDNILRPVGEAAQYRNKLGSKLVGFSAQEGYRYNNQLMVVGRALNGGHPATVINPTKLAHPQTREEYSELILPKSRPPNNKCPMEWIQDRWGPKWPKWIKNRRREDSDKHYKYCNPNRSAFFRGISQVTQELGVCGSGCDDWASYLVWSNLYKVSPDRHDPDRKGGIANPNKKLKDVQFEGCKELLIQEIQDFRPQRLLLLTGYWANKFLEDNFYKSSFKWDTSPAGLDYVCRTARSTTPDHSNMQIVVAEHPQTRREKKWVGEVVRAFNSM